MESHFTKFNARQSYPLYGILYVPVWIELVWALPVLGLIVDHLDGEMNDGALRDHHPTDLCISLTCPHGSVKQLGQRSLI